MFRDKEALRRPDRYKNLNNGPWQPYRFSTFLISKDTSGHTKTASFRQEGSDSSSSRTTMSNHNDVLTDHLTTWPHHNLFLTLGKLKGLCQTSRSRSLQDNPFHSSIPDFWNSLELWLDCQENTLLFFNALLHHSSCYKPFRLPEDKSWTFSVDSRQLRYWKIASAELAK